MEGEAEGEGEGEGDEAKGLLFELGGEVGERSL